jgi:DNA invertase Pin-like site-specific DNA recombinase
MRNLGWKEVEVINSDLGYSAGIASARREGFERVLSAVALGEVGIVGSWEVSRLSRTDKDWCRLLEVCQIFGTLIADEQHIYDLNSLDDQLVLGIKGTLSVVELKVLRQRMQAGQESKARRGELFKRLPVGYVLDEFGKVAFHPDRRVYEALQLVFIQFRELWSVRQTFQWFRGSRCGITSQPNIWNTARLEDPVTQPDSRCLVQSVLCWRVCMGTPACGDHADRRQAGEAPGRNAESGGMSGLYP